jgi:hypothetical protein
MNQARLIPPRHCPILLIADCRATQSQYRVSGVEGSDKMPALQAIRFFEIVSNRFCH